VGPGWADRLCFDRWAELLPTLPPDWPTRLQRQMALPDAVEAILATLPPEWMSIMEQVRSLGGI
jgi:hypothetical protein